jgi:hypothetical protein
MLLAQSRRGSWDGAGTKIDRRAAGWAKRDKDEAGETFFYVFNISEMVFSAKLSLEWFSAQKSTEVCFSTKQYSCRILRNAGQRTEILQ